jgi:hypothetical protein
MVYDADIYSATEIVENRNLQDKETRMKVQTRSTCLADYLTLVHHRLSSYP